MLASSQPPSHPARVRQFARASGQLAKTDPIDAAVLTAFGHAFGPEPTPARTATEITLAALVARRAQLLELRVAEAQRADTCAEPALQKLFKAWLAQMEKQIARWKRSWKRCWPGRERWPRGCNGWMRSPASAASPR